MTAFTDEQSVSLGILTRTYYDYQRERLALDGRLGQKKDGTLKAKAPARDEAWLMLLQIRRNELVKNEASLEKEIMRLIKPHPLWVNFLQHVKGVGPLMAAVILSEFDIHKAPTISNLWSFAGLAPGKDRKKKGQKCPYNQFLRAKLCGVLGGSFLKCKSVPYSGYYYETKMRLENSDKEIDEIQKGGKAKTIMWRDAKKGHRHKAATRKMIKHFLKDLYVAWREIEGLPIRPPYSEEYLGKKHAA